MSECQDLITQPQDSCEVVDESPDDKEETEVDCVNRCLICGIDMGECNPRQLCGKWRCYDSPT